ncbi:hypothetical protein WMF18_18410 [Sorangium sp. So ce315]|uniref:hypothetical protein n=1 Tax=Sorangium sp. So ce315 TaxID=3133299 RepID=UPI003F5D7C3C
MRGAHHGRARHARPARCVLGLLRRCVLGLLRRCVLGLLRRCVLGPLRAVRRGAFTAAAVLGAACLLGAAGAHAEPALRPSAARLDYVRGRGAERCPDASFLRAEVARVVGADPFRDDAALLVSVRIERQGPELVASLALRDGQGNTRWADGLTTSSACDVLVAGVGLAIATQLLRAPERAPAERSPAEPSPAEPSLRGPAQVPREAPQAPPPAHAPRGAPEPATRAAPEPPRPAAPGPSTSSVREVKADPPGSWRIEAGLGAAVALGITPGVAAGTTLALGVRWSDWSVAVEGRGLVSLAKEVEGLPLGMTAFSAATVACLHGPHLFGCGLATLGAVRFVPEDPWNMRLRSKALVGVGVRLGCAWRLSDRWSVHGHAEAIWIAEDAVLRRQVDPTVAPPPLYWTSPPLGAALGLGVTASY